MTQLLPLVDAIPPIGGKVGAPLRKPGKVNGDRAYDSDPHRMRLSGRAIATEIARRNTPHGSGLGVFRWFVEQALALLTSSSGSASATTATTRSTRRS